MEEKNIERLYKLLECAEREKDTETAAALRSAGTAPPAPMRQGTR